MSGEKELRICPRCGGTYSYIERARRGDRVYLYAVHYLGNGKKRKCYLGAEVYEYFNRVYGRVMELVGYSREDVVLEYLDELIEYLEKTSVREENIEKLKKILDKTEKIRKIIEEKIKEEK